MSEAKQELIRLIKKQPSDGTVEDVMRELIFHIFVLQALAEADYENGIPHEEMVRQIQELIDGWPGQAQQEA